MQVAVSLVQVPSRARTELLADPADGHRPLAVHRSIFFATWKGVQGDPAATLTDTVADQFWHGGGTDPTYSASNQMLVQHRLALLNRSNQLGPPPSANCP